jgi:hypothetical protein
LTYTARKIGAGANLKKIFEVIKQKQQDIERIRREIEALHVVLPMLDGAPAQVMPQLRPSSTATRH